jgi:hypothetical protein
MIRSVAWCFLLLFSCLHVVAQSDWTLKKDKDGIRVYSRTSSCSKFNELKAEFTIHSKLSELAAVLLDVDDHFQWSYSTKSSYLLKKISDSELVYYTQINSPWPVANRDLIVHQLITQDPVSKVMLIKADCLRGYVPSQKSVVRVLSSRSTYTVIPLDGNTIQVDYYLEIDPGGSVPAWLVNIFSTKGPYESFKNLRQQVLQSKYQHNAPLFIKD